MIVCPLCHGEAIPLAWDKNAGECLCRCLSVRRMPGTAKRGGGRTPDRFGWMLTRPDNMGDMRIDLSGKIRINFETEKGNHYVIVKEGDRDEEVRDFFEALLACSVLNI